MKLLKDRLDQCQQQLLEFLRKEHQHKADLEDLEQSFHLMLGLDLHQRFVQPNRNRSSYIVQQQIKKALQTLVQKVIVYSYWV
ncbi:MAG: hypothetical protein EAZ51_00200 [Sphingobacteriales bacterium]|nr:MAG: hypothetical protein EAZ51_00200 [Sphingobacteriales bacterium]